MYRIKEIIKKKGFKLQQLAELMGVSLPAINKFLVSDKLTTTTLFKFATALDVPVWQLFISPENAAKELKIDNKQSMGIVFNGRFISASSLEELSSIIKDLQNSDAPPTHS